jgi:serine/threonine protein kinase
VLINQDHRACLADFGLSTIVSVDPTPDSTLFAANPRDSLMSVIYGGSFPWMSPELLDYGEGCEHSPTKESDVYALGMLVYEVRTYPACLNNKNPKGAKQVLCGRIPYHDLANRATIVTEITKGTRPKKPKGAARFGFTDGLWKTVERCWSADTNARPTLGIVLSRLMEAGSRLDEGARWEIV